MQAVLDDIKKNFEIIPSVSAYEEYSNGIKVYNYTIAFYTYSKNPEELCQFSEMIFIGFKLGIPPEEKIFEIICNRKEGEEIKLLPYSLFRRYDRDKLQDDINKRIIFFKEQNNKMYFLDRVNWEINTYEDRIKEQKMFGNDKYKVIIGNKKTFCRRRLELYIASNNIEYELIKKETLCLTPNLP